MSINIAPTRFMPQDGHYVVVDVEMDDSHNVACHVNLTCTHKIVAMTGGVTLHYYDASGNKIGDSNNGNAYSLPCGPAPIIGAAHASGAFSDVAPAGTVRVLLGEYGANNWGPVIQFVEQVVKDVIDWLQKEPIPPTTDPGPYDDPNPPDPGPDDVQARFTLSQLAH